MLKPDHQCDQSVEWTHQPQKNNKKPFNTRRNYKGFFVASCYVPPRMPKPEAKKYRQGDGAGEVGDFSRRKEDEQKENDVHEEVLDGEHFVVEARCDPGAKFVGFVADLLEHLQKIARSDPGVA